MKVRDIAQWLPEDRRERIVGGVLILAGLLLRVRQLQCFEFKDDQARTVINGLCALRDMFLVSAGQPGSSGIPNPAGGAYLTGVMALAGTDAILFAAGFTLLSCLTVFGVWWALQDVLSKRRAWWCTVLTAVSPVLMWNASNLWGPGLLIFWVALFLRGCFMHVANGRKWALIQAGAAAACGAWMLHLSALFLFPGMVYAMIRRRPEWKDWAVLSGIGLLLFGPWIYTLIWVWDHQTMPMVFPWSEKICAWFVHLGGFWNGLFFLNYFPQEEFPGLVLAAAGISLVLGGGLFAAGVLPLLQWRKAGEGDRIALLLTIFIPVFYLVLGMRLYPHYLMVILLPCCVLASGAFEREGKWIFPTATVAGVLMLAVTFYWQNKVIAGNGHWMEFGPSGNYLEKVAAELDNKYYGTLSFRVVAADEKAKKKLDPISTLYIFDRHMQKDKLPCLLVLSWDDKLQKFTHRVIIPRK
jgi:hypothetical protein